MQVENTRFSLVSSAAVRAALDAFNAFPCPNPGSIARSSNEEQMRAALEAALGIPTALEGAPSVSDERTATPLADRILALYAPTTKDLAIGRKGMGVVVGGAFRVFANGSAQSQVAMFTGAEPFAEGELDANAAFYAGIHALIPEIIHALQSGSETASGTAGGTELQSGMGCKGMKKDYVILVSPDEPRGYLGLEGDEDDGEVSTIPPRTTDVDLAVRFDRFSDARVGVRTAAARYPNHSFRIDVAPHVSKEAA
ncbi:hypothetical protein K2O51_31115 (plasmid) [Cupriavidus pinatubonensis]|uniref:hypothetical protein n=1 Tax=Cupriavidus pinatubonensis TaxID=248026 RepID=UPI001C729E9D|nr:hypothetical protein [Cupriavidus pinatubonensis]QYY33697.1 hypothetical protein K2O51_31115 [Cupriavidus pinatubonensis]